MEEFRAESLNQLNPASIIVEKIQAMDQTVINNSLPSENYHLQRMLNTFMLNYFFKNEFHLISGCLGRNIVVVTPENHPSLVEGAKQVKYAQAMHAKHQNTHLTQNYYATAVHGPIFQFSQQLSQLAEDYHPFAAGSPLPLIEVFGFEHYHADPIVLQQFPVIF